MEQRQMYQTEARPSVLETNKVLRNTYMLLALTLAFSAAMAAVTTAIGIGFVGYISMFIGSFVCLFIVHKNAEKASGLFWVFAFTGLLGGALGYILQYYLALQNGPGLIMQSLGTTALVFFGLSGYVLTTKKDFSFMGGFLLTGLIVAVVAMLANLFFQIPALSLAISSAVVFIMSGFILYDTSRIIHGGETNYIRATVSMYLNIYNLFTSLLHLFSAFGDD